MSDKKTNKWILWYHPINENSWTKDTYTKVAEISSIKEFIELFNTFPSFLKGMFFLMREGIFPQWEDEQNINGGYFSYKISKNVAEKAWFDICACCIGEFLTKDEKHMKTINGVSYSPKINNCIIKILNNDTSMGHADVLRCGIENLEPYQSQYKPHMENASEFVFD